MHKRMLNWDEATIIASIIKEMTAKQIDGYDVYEMAHLVVDNYNRELVMEIAREYGGKIAIYNNLTDDTDARQRKIVRAVSEAHDRISILEEEMRQTEEGGF